MVETRGQSTPWAMVGDCPRCGSVAILGLDVEPMIGATSYYVCQRCPCWFWVVKRQDPATDPADCADTTSDVDAT